MAENFSIEHSRTKITEVKKTIEDKKQMKNSIKTGSRMKEATILRLKRILSFMMPLMF